MSKRHDPKYYWANREKILARKRAHRQANRERLAAEQRAHRVANREKVLNGYKRWREANKEARKIAVAIGVRIAVAREMIDR